MTELLEEDLVDLVQELEKLKFKLMEERENNLEKLAKCEEAIAYFQYIIYNLHFSIQMHKSHIDKYKQLASLYEKKIQKEDNYLNYYLLKINILKEEKQNQEKMFEDASKKLKIYNHEKTTLLIKQKSLDSLLLEVETEIANYKETEPENTYQKTLDNVDTN